MLTSFLPQLISALLSLATIRLYTEFLDPLQLGQTMLVIGVLALIDALLMSSINQTTFYFLNKEKTQELTIQLMTLINKYLIVLYILCIILTIASIYLYQISNYMIYFLTFFYILLSIIINPFKGAYLSYLNFLKKRNRYAIQIIIESLVTFFLVGIFAYFFNHWFFILIAFVLAKLITLTSNILLVKFSLNEKYTLNKVVLKIHLNNFIRYFKSITLMGILGWISAFADRFIIAFSIGVVTSGSYSVASGLVSRPYNVLTATFTTHFRPDFYNSINNNDLNKFTTTKIKWILNVLVTSIIGIVFFYFLSGIICDILLAEGYREKIQDYLWLLSITLTLSIFIHVYDNIFLATGNSNKLLKTQLFLAPIPLIFIFIGGYFYNIEGAIYGRIFSDFIKLFVTYNNSKGLI